MTKEGHKACQSLPGLNSQALAKGFQANPRHFVYLLIIHQPNPFPQAHYKISQPTLAVFLLLFIVTITPLIVQTLFPRSRAACVLECRSV